MRLLIFSQFIYFALLATPNVWIDNGIEKNDFREQVYSDHGLAIADYYLAEIEKRNIDATWLLSKTDFWTTNKISTSLIEQEIKELQTNSTLNISHRLILFEFFKRERPAAKMLCHLYANDLYLKKSEPFFEASCQINRISLKDINPILTKFDYMLIDGNKVTIQQSPYFFTTGQPHHFVFISNRFATKEITATAQALKTSSLSLEPWIEGSCDNVSKSNATLSEPVRIYFSKDCIQELGSSQSTTISFIKRNKYYIISGLLISLAAMYVSSQYELAVTLP